MKRLLTVAALCAAGLAFERPARAQCAVEVLSNLGYVLAFDPGETTMASGSFLGTQPVQILERSQGQWVLEDTVPLANGTQEGFGEALALDVDVLLVGIPRRDLLGVDEGAVNVYERIGGAWLPTATLVAGEPAAGASFGSALALLGATTALVESSAGIHVLERQGWFWTETQVVTSAGAVRDWSAEDDTLLVARGSSEVAVYARGPAGWDETQVLALPGSPPAQVQTVDLRGDLAVVGAPFGGPSFFQGQTFVLERAAGTWSLGPELLTPALDANSLFGSRVAAGPEAVAVMRNTAAGEDTHVFRRLAGVWTEASVLTQRRPLAWPADLLYTELGSPIVAWAPLPPAATCTAKVNSQGCTPSVAASGQPDLGSGLPFDVTASNVVGERNGLFFYGLSGPAALPLLGGTLCAQPPLRRTPVQPSGGDEQVPCSGAYAFDFNAWLAAGRDPLVYAGTRVVGQYWSRDPDHPDGTGAGLTDAVDFVVCP